MHGSGRYRSWCWLPLQGAGDGGERVDGRPARLITDLGVARRAGRGGVPHQLLRDADVAGSPVRLGAVPVPQAVEGYAGHPEPVAEVQRGPDADPLRVGRLAV